MMPLSKNSYFVVVNLEHTEIQFINLFLYGSNIATLCYIISTVPAEISDAINREMHRGVTYIPCRGAYTNQEKTLVYILTKTIELGHIRRIVLEKAPQAIISIIDTREVIGKGFSAVN